MMFVLEKLYNKQQEQFLVCNGAAAPEAKRVRSDMTDTCLLVVGE